MKASTSVLFLILFIIGLSSCKSIEKLVNKGEYEEALFLATKKFKGMRKAPTKQVKALEKGFAKLTANDEKRLQNLYGRHTPEKWDLIYNLAVRIEERQYALDLLLPIISKDGYIPTFDFLNTEDWKSEASTNAVRHHLQTARKLYNNFDSSGVKQWARAAYRKAITVLSYDPQNKEAETLRLKALTEGQEHVLLTWDDHFKGRLDESIIYMVQDFDLSSIRSFWHRYYSDIPVDRGMDRIISIAVDQVITSPERETINRREIRRIVETEEVVENQADSSGVQTVQHVEESTSYVTEIVRSKTLEITGHFISRDYRTGQVLYSEPFSVAEVFNSSAFSEERVGYDNEKGRVYEERLGSSKLLPFPGDRDLMYRIIKKVKRKFMNYVDGHDNFTT